MYHKLYIARREKRLRQKDVAKMLHIDPQTYHLKEAGKREFTLKEAIQLTKIFSMTLDELFGDEEDRVVASGM